eukprot:2908428-Rhodomonas_salina.2
MDHHHHDTSSSSLDPPCAAHPPCASRIDKRHPSSSGPRKQRRSTEPPAPVPPCARMKLKNAAVVLSLGKDGRRPEAERVFATEEERVRRWWEDQGRKH